jgi:small-conductance mechanosensitive channel
MVQVCYPAISTIIVDYSLPKIDAQFNKVNDIKLELDDKQIPVQQLRRDIFLLNDLRDFSELCIDAKNQLLQTQNNDKNSLPMSKTNIVNNLMPNNNVVNNLMFEDKQELFHVWEEKLSCLFLLHAINQAIDKSNLMFEKIEHNVKNPSIVDLLFDVKIWSLPIKTKDWFSTLRLNQISKQELLNCFYIFILSIFLSIFFVIFIRNNSNQVKKHYLKFILYKLCVYIPLILPLSIVFIYLWYINLEFGKQNNIILYFYFFVGIVSLRMMFYLYLDIIQVLMNKYWKKDISRAFNLIYYGMLIGFVILNYIGSFLVKNNLIILFEQIINLLMGIFFIYAWRNFYIQITQSEYFDSKKHFITSFMEFVFLFVIIITYLIKMILSCLGYQHDIVEFNFQIMLMALFILVFLNWVSLLNYIEVRLQRPENKYGAKLRQKMGIKGSSLIVELFVLRITFVIWSGLLFLSALIKILSVSPEYQLKYQELIGQGLLIGNVNIIPMHLIYAVTAFCFIRILSCIFVKIISSKPSFYHDIDRRNTTITLLRYLFFSIAFIVSLAMIGLGVNQLSVVIGAATIGFGVALQSLILDFISGIILILNKPVCIHDYILINGVSANGEPCLGYIQKIKLLSTQMVSDKGFIVIVPNAQFLKYNLQNYSAYNKTAKCYLVFKIFNYQDIETVKQILLKRIKEQDLVQKIGHQAPQIDVTRFIDKAMQDYFIINLKFTIKSLQDKSFVVSEIQQRVLDDFETYHIQHSIMKD